MPPVTKSITPDALATDAGHVAEFLRAVDAVVPGYVSEELLGFLDQLRGNRMTLELLAKSLSAGGAIR